MAVELCMEHWTDECEADAVGLFGPRCGPTAIAVDTQGRVVNMSPTAERVFGVGLAGVKGLPVEKAIPDASLRALVVQAMTHRGPARARVPRRGGRKVRMEASAQPIRGEAGRESGAVVLVREL